jgi:hypothetical protein
MRFIRFLCLTYYILYIIFDKDSLYIDFLQEKTLPMAITDPKQAYIEALELLPEGLQDFLTKQIPEAPTCDAPGDVESAIIAQGLLSKFLLDLFREFAGLTPIPIFMRIGQHNPVLQSMLFAGLEYIGGAIGLVEIVAPKAGGVYYGYFSDWKVKVLRGQPDKITIECNDDSQEMVNEGEFWTAAFPIPIGEHTAKVSGEGFEKTVSFSIKHYEDMPTFPEEGGEYDTVDHVGLYPQDSFEDIQEASVKIGNLTITLSPQEPNFEEIVEDLESGRYSGLFKFVTKMNKDITKIVNFIVK